MVGGRLPFLPWFSKYRLLLFMVVLHGVETDLASIFHRTAGDTVEFPSGLPNEGFIVAHWEYGEKRIAGWDGLHVTLETGHQFEGRVVMNPTNFSLTVESLTFEDSGNFIIVSELNGTQHPTTTFVLQVHEAITKKPILTLTDTWHKVNNSCTILLECNADGYRNVNYTWTLRNQTYRGSNVSFSLQPSEGDITVSCTASNVFSEMSASQTVPKCISELVRSVIYVAVSAGCAVVLVVTIAVVIYHYKQRQADNITTENTIYADVSDVGMKDVRSNSLGNPSLIYETINDPVNLTTSPHTVYDKIQFDRPTGASTSPFQNVC